jgi:uncharacterized protein (DUF1684 family)
MGRSRRLTIAVPAVSILAVACAGAPTPHDEAALRAFRAEREAVLLADDGWFTVAGLHFLNQGDSTFGSGPGNDVVLPYAAVPDQAGVIAMDGAEVTIRSADGARLVHNGESATAGRLRLSTPGQPADVVTYGAMSFFLHYSGPRLAIRVRDQNAPLREEFSGLKWFDPDPSFRTTGAFVALDQPTVVQAPNILGDLEPFTVAGTVTFDLAGDTHTMEAWQSGERLWFVMRDLTSVDMTYPAARFLYTDTPDEDGTVVMDFNYARNPPCAYNSWTTCPLPPASNQLAMRIEAGELRYHAE